MKQIDRIKQILEEEGQIDNFYCVNTHFTLRLAMHIGVLRKRGWKIRTEELDNKNCIYHFESKPDAEPLPERKQLTISMV